MCRKYWREFTKLIFRSKKKVKYEALDEDDKISIGQV